MKPHESHNNMGNTETPSSNGETTPVGSGSTGLFADFVEHEIQRIKKTGILPDYVKCSDSERILFFPANVVMSGPEDNANVEVSRDA